MAALKMAGWNKSKAAQQLNWSRMTIYRKMCQYGINEGPRDRHSTTSAASANAASLLPNNIAAAKRWQPPCS